MKHVAAYLLAVLGGKASPSEADITKIITAGGGKADAEAVKNLIKEFAGKTADQVIAAGTYFTGCLGMRFLALCCLEAWPPFIYCCVSHPMQARPSSPPSLPVVPPLPLPLLPPRALPPLPLPRPPPRHPSLNPKRRRPAVASACLIRPARFVLTMRRASA